MKKTNYIIVTILLYGIIGSTITAQQLIAHYTLSSNANDSTGQNPAMTLINTPFQDGGIYCNGIYGGSGNPDYCHAITPNLGNLDMNAFSISAKFKVTESLTERHPVFVGGQSYRWVAFYLETDSTVLLKYNNNKYASSSVRYTLNQWHEATINYKDSILKLYLDDTLAISVNINLIYGDDRDIGITDFSSGEVFKGIFRDLKIINLDSVSTDIEDNVKNFPIMFSLAQNYPNPFNPNTKIRFTIPASSLNPFSKGEVAMVTLKVYDLLGNQVATLVNEEKPAGVYEVEFNSNSDGGQDLSAGRQGLSSGVYFYKLQAGSFFETKKMILIK